MIHRTPATKDLVLAQALSLSESDRLEIIHRLSDSLDGRSDAAVTEAWDREVDRRLDEIEAGRATFVPWDEAKERIARGTRGPHA